MGLGACGGGMGEDCGEGLAMLLCSKDSSLSKDHFLKATTKCKGEISLPSMRNMGNLTSLGRSVLLISARGVLQFGRFN